MSKKDRIVKKKNRVGNFFHRLFYGVDPTPLAGGSFADDSETEEILEGFPSGKSHDFLDIPDTPEYPDTPTAFEGGHHGYDLDGGGSFGGAGSGGSWSDGDSGSYGSSDSGSSDSGSSDSGGGCDGGGGSD